MNPFRATIAESTPTTVNIMEPGEKILFQSILSGCDISRYELLRIRSKQAYSSLSSFIKSPLELNSRFFDSTDIFISAWNVLTFLSSVHFNALVIFALG